MEVLLPIFQFSSIHSSMYSSIHISIDPSIYIVSFYPFIYLFIHPPIYLSLYPSIHSSSVLEMIITEQVDKLTATIRGIHTLTSVARTAATRLSKLIAEEGKDKQVCLSFWRFCVCVCLCLCDCMSVVWVYLYMCVCMYMYFHHILVKTTQSNCLTHITNIPTTVDWASSISWWKEGKD